MATEIIPIPVKPINCYLIKGRENIIIDTGFPGNTNIIINELCKNNVSPKDISLIVITHGHSDHFGSLYELKNETDAEILIHEKEINAIQNKIESPLVPINFTGKISTIFRGLNSLKHLYNSENMKTIKNSYILTTFFSYLHIKLSEVCKNIAHLDNS